MLVLSGWAGYPVHRVPWRGSTSGLDQAPTTKPCLSLDKMSPGVHLDRSLSESTPPLNAHPGAARHMLTPPLPSLPTHLHMQQATGQPFRPIPPHLTDCRHPQLAHSPSGHRHHPPSTTPAVAKRYMTRQPPPPTDVRARKQIDSVGLAIASYHVVPPTHSVSKRG